MEKISKSDAKRLVEEFFKEVRSKKAGEIKKIKRFSMRYNLPLKEKRKLFCKKCFVPYKDSRINIKKGIKSVACKECGYIARWKINSS